LGQPRRLLEHQALVDHGVERGLARDAAQPLEEADLAEHDRAPVDDRQHALQDRAAGVAADGEDDEEAEQSRRHGRS
jgi:hypothetical protein